MALVLKLKILTGRHSGREIEIKRSKFVIGRADDCDLRPASSDVSRRHCVLIVDADRVKLQDLDAANGTLVNGERISGLHELAPGDRIQVGPLEFQTLFAASELRPPAAGQPQSVRPAKAPSPTAPLAKTVGAEDEIMQWLTDAPSEQPKSIYVELDAGEATASSDTRRTSDTERISLDGTLNFAWPESPPVAATLPPSAPVSDLLNHGKPGAKLPDPNAAGNTRDAAAAAIDMFRHRNDKPRPAGT
jgi:pSer/pThr/pTyr-binding forkhead associated (FHA) protein